MARVEELTLRLLRRWPLPPLDPGGGKDARGAVLVIAGSSQMPGAAVLAATAALRAGAGKLQIATAKCVAQHVAAQVPEALVVGLPETRRGGLQPKASLRALLDRAERAAAIVLGPGLLDAHAAGALAAELCSRVERVPIVLDAEALECCSSAPDAIAAARTRIVVTPHANEMAHLLGVQPSLVKDEPRAMAERAARTLQLFAVLKGAETFLAAPSGRTLRNRRAGNAGLGTSGSGDTLSGIVAGLLARGAEPLQAAAFAVWAHGRAGDALARKIGPLGYLARELLDEIPRALAAI